MRKQQKKTSTSMDILRLQRTLAVGRLFFLASEHGSESAGKTWIFQFNRKIPME